MSGWASRRIWLLSKRLLELAAYWDESKPRMGAHSDPLGFYFFLCPFLWSCPCEYFVLCSS